MTLTSKIGDRDSCAVRKAVETEYEDLKAEMNNLQEKRERIRDDFKVLQMEKNPMRETTALVKDIRWKGELHL